MHIITAKIKVFQKPQAFLTIIMINEAIKKQTEDNYYICNKQTDILKMKIKSK